MAEEEILTVMTWNVNSLVPTVRNMELKHRSFKGFLEAFNVDIACFQETKLPDSRITKDLACLPGFESFWAVSREKQGYSGVTTWAKQQWSPLKAEVDSLGGGDEDIDREGRVVITDHGTFVLINVYAPNAGDAPARNRLDYKCCFLAALKERMDAYTAQGRQVITVGDLNIAAEPRDVHPTFNHAAIYTERELELMSRLLHAYPDVWRQRHPDTTDVFTVWDEKTSARAFNAGFRLDYVLVSPSLMPHVVSCEVLTDKDIPPKWSDHAAVRLILKGLSPSPPHAPCALSSAKDKRFNQPSIAAMLLGSSTSRKRALPAASTPSLPTNSTPDTISGGTACAGAASRASLATADCSITAAADSAAAAPSPPAKLGRRSHVEQAAMQAMDVLQTVQNGGCVAGTQRAVPVHLGVLEPPHQDGLGWQDRPVGHVQEACMGATGDGDGSACIAAGGQGSMPQPADEASLRAGTGSQPEQPEVQAGAGQGPTQAGADGGTGSGGTAAAAAAGRGGKGGRSRGDGRGGKGTTPKGRGALATAQPTAQQPSIRSFFGAPCK